MAAKKKARRPVAKAKVAPIASEATPVAVEVPTTTPTEPAPVEMPVETRVEDAKSTPRHRAGMIGAWAYIVGIVIALGAAVFVQQGLDFLTYVVLAILGIVVGLLNITDDEILLFLVATVALVVTANSVRDVLQNVPFMSAFLKNVIIFTAASAFVVSIKALFRLAKNE